ncbi:unnamed protein product [marine sediment metagenome]|uniref:Uncharacterized protein n=1 Tax=marine sediment metagenome TaxID=412755 RepID=X1AFC1_9ZZZZ
MYICFEALKSYSHSYHQEVVTDLFNITLSKSNNEHYALATGVKHGHSDRTDVERYTVNKETYQRIKTLMMKSNINEMENENRAKPGKWNMRSLSNLTGMEVCTE